MKTKADLIKKIFFIYAAFLFIATPLYAASKPLRIYANLVAGYDNNVFLNSERKADGFAQEDLNLDYYTPLYKDALRFRVSYDILNNNYFETPDFNYLYQDLNLGLDYRIMDGTWIQLDYDLIYADFYDNAELTTLSNKGHVSLAQTLTDSTSLKLGFGSAVRDFEERKLRQPDGQLSTGDERLDTRQEIEAEVLTHFANKTVLRAGVAYLWNDSNDQFQDYYDYDSYKIYVSTAVPVCKSWTLLGRISYQNDDYASRSLIDNLQEFQNDDVYQGSIGLSKRLRENVSVTGLYSYRQKVSNEPSQSYSGSIVTLGLYTSF